MEMEGSPLLCTSSTPNTSSPHGVDPPFLRPSHMPATGGYRIVLFIPRPPYAMAHTAMLVCCSQTAATALAGQKLVLPGGCSLLATTRSSQWWCSSHYTDFLPMPAPFNPTSKQS